MKKQTRNTEVQINKEEIGKLPEKEFRIMIVKMIKNLENKMEKRQEYWSRLPFPSPGNLLNPGIKPRSPALQAATLTSEPPGKPRPT